MDWRKERLREWVEVWLYAGFDYRMAGRYFRKGEERDLTTVQWELVEI